MARAFLEQRPLHHGGNRSEPRMRRFVLRAPKRLHAAPEIVPIVSDEFQDVAIESGTRGKKVRYFQSGGSIENLKAPR